MTDALGTGGGDRPQVVGMGVVQELGLCFLIRQRISKLKEGLDWLEVRQQARDELAELGAPVSLAASLDQHFGQVRNIRGPLDDVVVCACHGCTVKALVGPGEPSLRLLEEVTSHRQPCSASVANLNCLQQGVDILMPVTLGGDEHVRVLLAQFCMHGEVPVVWLGEATVQNPHGPAEVVSLALQLPLEFEVIDVLKLVHLLGRYLLLLQGSGCEHGLMPCFFSCRFVSHFLLSVLFRVVAFC